MPSGSLWMSCTVRPLTSRPTPTSIPYSWAAWVGQETSTLTTCWNCWGRSLAQSQRQSTSQSANERVIDVIDSSLNWTAYWTIDSGESINWKEKSDNCAKKQPSDTVVITFMLYTALISSKVQRENVSEASLLLFTLLLQVDPFWQVFYIRRHAVTGFSFHVKRLTYTVWKCCFLFLFILFRYFLNHILCCFVSQEIPS